MPLCEDCFVDITVSILCVDIPVNASRELQQSSVADYDSDTPPSDSLRTIKEVAKARLKEAKEKNKDKVGTSSSDRIPGSNERKSSLSRLPRPLGGL